MGYHDIVIIDDGVDERYIGTSVLRYNLEVGPDLRITERSDMCERHLSHGTVCAAIIAHYAPDASLGSIKVLDSRLHQGTRGQLEAALKWCLEQKPMLVSLSIGTIQSKDFDEIRPVLSELYRKGFVLVAAYNNHFRYTVPASLECVVGVRRKFFTEGRYGVNGDGFEVFAEACSVHELTLRGRGRYHTPSSNSYAAPYVTALLHNSLPGDFSGDIACLWEMLGQEREKPFCFFPDFLDSAVVAGSNEDEWPELFYFKAVTAELAAGPGKTGEGIYLVVLEKSASLMRSILAETAVRQEYIKGIFCCWEEAGIGKGNLGGLGSRIWQEGYYIEKYRKYTSPGELEIPVVYFYGERRLLIGMLQALKGRFLEEGYNAKAVGQFRRAYLYGLEYIDIVQNRETILYNVYKRFDCDIILCGIASREVIHDVEDVCFWMWEDMPGDEKVSRIPVRESAGDWMAEEIFRRIMALFDTDNDNRELGF